MCDSVWKQVTPCVPMFVLLLHTTILLFQVGLDFLSVDLMAKIGHKPLHFGKGFGSKLQTWRMCATDS